jgi:hypothetical protein
MDMDNDTLENFRNHVFYHGTSLEAAESIVRHGFRVWFEEDEIGRVAAGGNLGTGLYITCNWRVALWFGHTLLRVAIRPGTKLLNSVLPPDRKILNYLQREFGREILEKAPWKVLPNNKKLKLPELISLFRYHYWHTWKKDCSRWPRRRTLHSQLLSDFRKMLIRYGFHGYGNPDDDNGIVVFAEDRLVLQEVVAQFTPEDYWTLEKQEFRQLQDIEKVKEFFRRHGSERAKDLAKQVAAANRSKLGG